MNRKEVIEDLEYVKATFCTSVGGNALRGYDAIMKAIDDVKAIDYAEIHICYKCGYWDPDICMCMFNEVNETIGIPKCKEIVNEIR